MYKLYMSFRFTLPKMSTQLSAYHDVQPIHLRTVLTHWDAEGNQDKRDDAKDFEHRAATGLAGPGVDECGECIEQEVLEHHLQDEDFCRLSRKRVPEKHTSIVSPREFSTNTRGMPYRIYNPADVDGTEIPKQAQP